MPERTVTSGYLIEKTFARMCREHLSALARRGQKQVNTGPYSTPRTDFPSERMTKQYHGLQREPIQGWLEDLHGSGVVEPEDQELEASLFLAELERTGKAADDIVFALEDARKLVAKIEPPVEREIVWARRIDGGDTPPSGTVLLGYEPSQFYPPTCDSAVAEGLFFTYPIPDDREGLRLKTHHDRLNQWGLFNTPAETEEYLTVYLASLPPDWDEHLYRYHTTEVRAIVE
jgi:hypothetical protein